MDSQVKIRGNRIELGEIESQLLMHSRVKEAAVTLVFITGVKGVSGQICAYYVPEKEVEETELRDYLSGKLPDYMIPAYFTAMEQLPLTAKGKVDRKALPVLGARPTGEEYIAPADEIEKRLARIWSRILGREEGQISALYNFFELGGIP